VVETEIARLLIDRIKDGSLPFIDDPVDDWLATSTFLNGCASTPSSMRARMSSTSRSTSDETQVERRRA
jgi:hypothetical protein